MAIKHREIVKSKEGVDSNDRSSQTSLIYLLTGSDVIDDMRAYLDADPLLVPGQVDGLFYKSLSREQLGRRIWRWEAEYIEADVSDLTDKLVTDEEAVFSFDTTGASSIVFATSADPSILTKYPPGATDHKGSINVGENEVKGTDIVIPVLKLSYRKRIPTASITAAYVKTLARLTGTVNAAVFKAEWAAEELLFLGATGQQGTKTDPEVTFQFAASENVTGLTIGEVVAIAKKGHDYLWVEFEPAVDATAKALARRPKSVYVHKVYKLADWSALGI